MSLETLLEAAEYLDGSTRGKEKSQDFHKYAKAPSSGSDSSSTNNNDMKGYAYSDDGKDRRRAGGAGTREVHNILEKNRRAHLKECFELLKEHIPSMEDKKMSNLSILRGSLRYIQILKRKEKEYEQDMQRLAREKILNQNRVAHLKRDLLQLNIECDLSNFMLKADADGETNSTSTASEGCSPIVSEDEGANHKKNTVKSSPVPVAMISSPVKTTSVAHSKAATLVTNAVNRTTLNINAVPVSVPHTTVKPQVAQLLQRTITQRAMQHQAQQLQQKQQQQMGQSAVPSVLNIQTSPVRSSFTIPASAVRLPTHVQAITMAKVPSSTGALTLVTSGTGTLTIPTVTATIATSCVSTTSGTTQVCTADGMHGIAGAMVKPTPAIVTLVTSTNPLQVTPHPVVTSGTEPSVSTGAPVTTIAAAQPGDTTCAVTTSLKPIINPATAQILTPGNPLSAISQMVQQAIGRAAANTTMTNVIPTVTQLVTANPNNLTGVGQTVTTLASIAPVTQIVTPITVMTPAMVHVSQSASQQQLNSVVNPSIIKSMGTIPAIIQQPFLQQAQVLGQQVLKPVIMVTVPSSVAAGIATPTIASIPTPTTATVQLAVSVPKTTSASS